MILNKLSIIVFLLSFMGFSQCAFANDKNTWTLDREKNDIQVFSRVTPTGYDKVKAVVSVEANIEDFLQLLENVAIAPQWIDNCEKIEVLASPSASEQIFRTDFSSPWPIKDRYMLTHSQTTVDAENGDVRIVLTDVADQYPPINGKVNILNVSATWHISIVDEHTIRIAYEGYAEASGNLPKWLANQMIKSSLYKTFNNMRDVLQNG